MNSLVRASLSAIFAFALALPALALGTVQGLRLPGW
jgi:hypothetical protein